MGTEASAKHDAEELIMGTEASVLVRCRGRHKIRRRRLWGRRVNEVCEREQDKIRIAMLMETD